MPFAAIWVDLEIITLSEVRQRKTNIWYHSYVESKNIQMNQTKKSNQRTKTESQTEKANLQLPKGKAGRDNRYTPLYVKQINSNLLCSTGNCIYYNNL